MAKKEKYPDFLKYVEVDQGDIEWCQSKLRNWMVTHAYISKLAANERSLEILRRLMLVEFLRTPSYRWHIVQRLHGRYDELRYKVEREQIKAA